MSHDTLTAIDERELSALVARLRREGRRIQAVLRQPSNNEAGNGNEPPAPVYVVIVEAHRIQ